MRLTLPIREILPVTPRARIVRLELKGSEFSYVAGQAVLAGRPGNPARRQYSISVAPEEAKSSRVLELLVGTNATGALPNDLPDRPGESVEIEGPVGDLVFPSNPARRGFVFVAGGTGIAPLRAMVGHALRRGLGPICVLYSARTPEEFAYGHELRALARLGRIGLTQIVTRADCGLDWSGLRGRITPHALAPCIGEPGTHYFICGPASFVATVRRILQQFGVPAADIRIEGYVARLLDIPTPTSDTKGQVISI
jgi:ferredoxin-NADP reductase